jgi:hypothetical protein
MVMIVGNEAGTVCQSRHVVHYMNNELQHG